MASSRVGAMASGQRRPGTAEAAFAGKQRRRECKPEGDGLAGAGLGGDERVPSLELGIEHRLLHRGERLVAALAQGLGDRRNDAVKISHGNRLSKSGVSAV